MVNDADLLTEKLMTISLKTDINLSPAIHRAFYCLLYLERCSFKSKWWYKQYIGNEQ